MNFIEKLQAEQAALRTERKSLDVYLETEEGRAMEGDFDARQEAIDTRLAEIERHLAMVAFALHGLGTPATRQR